MPWADSRCLTMSLERGGVVAENGAVDVVAGGRRSHLDLAGLLGDVLALGEHGSLVALHLGQRDAGELRHVRGGGAAADPGLDIARGHGNGRRARRKRPSPASGWLPPEVPHRSAAGTSRRRRHSTGDAPRRRGRLQAVDPAYKSSTLALLTIETLPLTGCFRLGARARRDIPRLSRAGHKPEVRCVIIGDTRRRGTNGVERNGDRLRCAAQDRRGPQRGFHRGAEVPAYGEAVRRGG